MIIQKKHLYSTNVVQEIRITPGDPRYMSVTIRDSVNNIKWQNGDIEEYTVIDISDWEDGEYTVDLDGRDEGTEYIEYVKINNEFIEYNERQDSEWCAVGTFKFQKDNQNLIIEIKDHYTNHVILIPKIGSLINGYRSLTILEISKTRLNGIVADEYWNYYYNNKRFGLYLWWDNEKDEGAIEVVLSEWDYFKDKKLKIEVDLPNNGLGTTYWHTELNINSFLNGGERTIYLTDGH